MEQGGRSMNGKQRGLRRWDGRFGLTLVAVLLAPLVVAGTATAQNTAYGTGALVNNRTGRNDSAFGFDALYSNTTGNANTASGTYSLLSNSTGSNNTASGYNS